MASCVGGSKAEQKVLVALLAVTLLALQLFPRAAAVPALYASDSQREGHECLLKENTEALCQRCAKSTRSTMVYPMCCRDQEEVRAWCVRYLEYGLQ